MMLLKAAKEFPARCWRLPGLALNDLEPHIKKTNIHLPANSQLHISLHNGPRAFLLTDPVRALYGLVTNLRKVRMGSLLAEEARICDQIFTSPIQWTAATNFPRDSYSCHRQMPSTRARAGFMTRMMYGMK